MPFRSFLVVVAVVFVGLLASHRATVDAAPTSASGGGSQAAPPEVVRVELDPHWRTLRRSPVAEWSVDDVAFWMNYSIGYPEYSPYIQKHRVDGPTLLYLTPELFDTYFPMEHEIHLIKLRAHLDLLRGKCLCPNADSGSGSHAEFWSLLRHDNTRFWMMGLTALQFPRLSMAVGYFYDYDRTFVPLMRPATMSGETLELPIASQGEELPPTPASEQLTWLEHTVYWLAALVCPDGFLAYQCMRLMSTNYVIMPFFIFHFVLQQYNEYFLLYALYKGDAFESGMSLKQKVWQLYSWFLFMPVIAVISGYVLPLLLQQLVVFVLCGHAAMVMVGLAIHLFSGGGGGQQPESGAASGSEKRE